MNEKERPEQNPEETPEIYVVKKDVGGWRFDRRTFLTAAGAGAAAAALGSCGKQEPVVIMVTETASPIPPTSTLIPAGQPSPEPGQPTNPPDAPTQEPTSGEPPAAASDTPVSTATEAPTNTPTAETPRAEFVKDVTVPDGTRMRPGQPFTKTWRYRNSGTVPWGDGVKLVFVSGNFGGYESNKMGGPDFVNVPNVAPGDTVDISVNMVAPNAPARYRSYWRLQLPSGEWLENNHYADIVVQPPATATRPPATATQPPAATAPPCNCVGDQGCGCDNDCGCDKDCGCDRDSHYWHPN